MAGKMSESAETKAASEIASPRRGAKRLERARRAETAYTEAAQDYQDGAKLMARGLSNMLKASQGLLHIPASTQVVSRRAILNRASRWMEAQLFQACHTGDWFGTLRLRHIDRPKSGESFVQSEANLIGRLVISSAQAEQKWNENCGKPDQSCGAR